VSTQELAKKTAEAIRQRGWGQGDYCLPDGTCLCVFGGMAVALGAQTPEAIQEVASDIYGNWVSSAFEEVVDLVQAIHLRIPNFFKRPNRTRQDNVTRWNDWEDQRQENVLAVLDDIAGTPDRKMMAVAA